MSGRFPLLVAAVKKRSGYDWISIATKNLLNLSTRMESRTPVDQRPRHARCATLLPEKQQSLICVGACAHLHPVLFA